MSKVSPISAESLHSGGVSRAIVIGFSVRALAEATSALGLLPLAVDHFADHDCLLYAHRCIRLPVWGGRVTAQDVTAQDVSALGTAPSTHAHSCDYRKSLADWLAGLERFGPQPVLLGGGSENWPELVDLLHEHYQVLGPTTEQLAKLRCVDFWNQIARHSNVRFPETRDALPCSEAGQQYWLLKRFRGAGGHAIRRSTALQDVKMSVENPVLRSTNCYWQREIPGRALGVHCILFDDRSEVLGVTESFTADDWAGPTEFIYRGSWGPVPIQPQQHTKLIELCDRIRVETGLLGWLQMDFIEDAAGELWLLELNPRWAAGMEVLFHAGINAVEHHLAAWNLFVATDRRLSDPARKGNGRNVGVQSSQLDKRNYPKQFAKAVVYAGRDTHLTREVIDSLHTLPLKNFADIPSLSMVNRTIGAGHPLLTVRTSHSMHSPGRSVRQQLLQSLHELRSIMERSCLPRQ